MSNLPTMKRKNLRATIDPTDNSVTLNKELYDLLSASGGVEGDIFAFRLADSGEYGFMVNAPTGDVETQKSRLQYNGKYETVGFESLNPSVVRICYEYGLDVEKPHDVEVEVRRLKGGKEYYVMTR